MGKKIKCKYCVKTTTQGYNEKSGFNHLKLEIGKGVGKRTLDISACSEHSSLAYIDLDRFMLGK